jgi:hypothetical protein
VEHVRLPEPAQLEDQSAEGTERFDQLIGRQPAEMGSLFDGIDLAASFKGFATGKHANDKSFEPKKVRERIADATYDGRLWITVDARNEAVHVMTRGGPPQICRTLHAKLQAAWGKGNVWLDPATHRRARFDDHNDEPRVQGYPYKQCTLSFDHYIDAEELVARVPFDMIGRRGAALGKVEVPDNAWPVHPFVALRVPGLGGGRGSTRITAYVDEGRIRDIDVYVNGDPDSIAALRDGITDRLQVRSTKESGDVRWKLPNMTVWLSPLRDGFDLRIGPNWDNAN